MFSKQTLIILVSLPRRHSWACVTRSFPTWGRNAWRTPKNVCGGGYFNFEDVPTFINSLLVFCASHRTIGFLVIFFSFPFLLQVFAPCKVIQIPEFEKIFLVESRMLDFGTRNLAMEYLYEWNPPRQSPSSTGNEFGIKYLNPKPALDFIWWGDRYYYRNCK